MKLLSLVIEPTPELSLREFDITETIGPRDLKVEFAQVGGCGSDVHSYQYDSPVSIDVVAAQIKEARIESVFRSAHVFPKAVATMGIRKIDVRPVITHSYPFEASIEAFDYACNMRPERVMVQI